MKQEIDLQAGIVRPLVVYAIGGEKNIKTRRPEVAERILKQLPETMRYVESYAEDAMNVRTTLVERMRRLSP